MWRWQGVIYIYIHKPPLIKWAYKQKVWEKVETAAFSPRLLQIGWPPEPIWKEFLLKWLPKGLSPQPSRGRGGGWQWASGLLVGHSCSMPFQGSIFKCKFWAFGLHSRALGYICWIPLVCFFKAFAALGRFWKIVLPCRRELKKQGSGVAETARKSHPICSWCWTCLRNPVFTENMQLLWKKCFQMEPKLEPKSALGGTSFTYFHPWVVKVAQLVPDGTQRLPRVPKDYQNGAKMLPKVMKTWPCRHLNNCDSPNGGAFL